MYFITKDSLISKIVVNDMLNVTFGSISKSIKKEKRFSYPDFGTFSQRNRKEKKSSNEKKIKASKTFGFKPASTIKKSLVSYRSQIVANPFRKIGKCEVFKK